jgi:hypothetical protein
MWLVAGDWRLAVGKSRYLNGWIEMKNFSAPGYFYKMNSSFS